MLQIPLMVEAELERGKPVRLDGFTLVVNAHGGLLELGIPLRSGLKITLFQTGSGVWKRARTVGLRRSQDSDGFLVSFEFDSPTPKFWPIEFPPPDWQATEDCQV